MPAGKILQTGRLQPVPRCQASGPSNKSLADWPTDHFPFWGAAWRFPGGRDLSALGLLPYPHAITGFQQVGQSGSSSSRRRDGPEEAKRTKERATGSRDTVRKLSQHSPWSYPERAPEERVSQPSGSDCADSGQPPRPFHALGSAENRPPILSP